MKKLITVTLLVSLAIFGYANSQEGPNSTAVVSLDLVVTDPNKIDDKVISGSAKGSGEEIIIEIFITNLTTPISGMRFEFNFDESILELGIVTSKLFEFIIPQGTVVNFAALRRFRVDSSGYLATVRFKVLKDVTNREFSIGIKEIIIAEEAGLYETLTTPAQIVFNSSTPVVPPPPPKPSLLVATQDSLRMARQGDLNFDGVVNFNDFLILSQNFGKIIK